MLAKYLLCEHYRNKVIANSVRKDIKPSAC